MSSAPSGTVRPGTSAEEEHVTDDHDELARDSDSLLGKVADLRRLEIEKRRQPVSSPRFHQLAEAVTAKAREIMYGAEAEERDGNRTERSSTSIDESQSDAEVQ
jgi:hypothetical protein